jgi:hypothetical protein
MSACAPAASASG